MTTSRTGGPAASQRLKLKATLALAAAPFATLRPAWAQSPAAVAEYPNRTVRWICPSSTGAGTDAATRAFAQIASDTWKQGCVVDNRSGASGMIGLEMLANAPPDGYTLCVMSVSMFLDGTLSQKFSFDAKKDFTPLSLLATVPMVLVTSPQSNIRSLQELIAYAKAHPGQLNYSSGGAGGVTHFAMEFFLAKAGIKATHVPYKGSGPAIADVLAGHIQMTFVTPVTAMAYVKSGKVNPIGVSAASRSILTPGVPTFTEGGLPGIELSTWYGFFAPANMPQELAQKISSTVVAAANPPAAREKLVRDGMEPVLTDPGQFATFLAGEKLKWAQVAKDIGFKREG